MLVLCCVLGPAARAFEMRMTDERLHLRAEDVPLEAILWRFAHAGVRVRLDPLVHKRVSIELEDEDLQKGLDRVIQPFSYVLIWDAIPGPLGKMPRLAEIQVFRSGMQEQTQKWPTVDDRLVVSLGPGGRGPAFAKDELLIGLKPGTDVAAFKRLLAQIGGTVTDCCPELGVYRVRLPPETNVPDLVKQLAGNPIVAVAEPNYVFPMPPPVMTKPAADGAAPAVPAGAQPVASTAPVAVLDTGLLADSGLDAAVVAKLDALNPERAVADTHGHGTQMAMIASGAISPLGMGPAPSSDAIVPLVPVRAFDDSGNASSLSLMRAIEFAIANGARVVNLSWSTPTRSEFVANAVAYAQAKGAIVVAAAGNEPDGQPVFPAALPGVVAVSALDADGGRWEKSNYGDFVACAAPGLARMPADFAKSLAGSYAGTSISSALVANALSRYLSAHPDANAHQAVAALQAALTDAGAKGLDPYYGAGVLDAAALKRLLQ